MLPSLTHSGIAYLQELSGKPVLDLSLATVSKLLRALNECTEWGQVRSVDSCVWACCFCR